MKKIFLSLMAVLFAGILFTSASPSLDGRAVVAAESVFPRGYFAKTVGYLPGDSIKVTNPVNGARIDILVIGSLDASDGVAILLSPEAAEALSIKRNSNNLVKLTKRNGTADDVVSGSALITKVEDAEEVAEELEQEEIETEEIALAEEETSEEIALAEEIPESAIEYSEDLTLAENEVEEETAKDIAEEIAQIEDESDENITEEFAEVADEIPEDEIFDENIAEELVRVDDEIPEEIAALPPEYEYIVADDIPDDSLESEEIADFSERVNEEEIQEEFAFESELEKVEDAEIAEEFDESDFVENEISENLAEDEAEEIPELSEAEENLLEDEEEYEAIVLVPSEENPPAPREEIEDKKEIASSEISAPVEEKPEPKSEKSYAAVTELAPRKYYVQIAVYNEAENVEEVNELYGKRYPLVVLEKGRRKTVMVGPFNVDEYGIILERFKAYGFKDAFVKSTF
ncbi:MAG: hypothetical protein HDR36_04020 [Treponema sp.]|nr:hypothetical protein [Treponema sp.]MBD5440786.1 hypothetical protein [Treponema sp.]